MKFYTEEAKALTPLMREAREILVEEMRVHNWESKQLPEDICSNHPTRVRGLKIADLICEIDAVFGPPH